MLQVLGACPVGAIVSTGRSVYRVLEHGRIQTALLPLDATTLKPLVLQRELRILLHSTRKVELKCTPAK